jgi:TPR repeat protein
VESEINTLMKRAMQILFASVLFLSFSTTLMHAQSKEACYAGNGNACFDVAVSYAVGFLSEGDPVAADAWYKRALAIFRTECSNGKMIACQSLGGMYLSAQGVTKDEAQASSFYRKACDGGYMSGCASLGYMYSRGKGVSKNQGEAIALYRKACDGGDGGGCDSLAEAYYSGEGVPQDKTKAIALYGKACTGGYSWSCETLGEAYDAGNGVPQDKTKAIELYRKACSLRSTSSACDKLPEKR